MPAKTKTGRTSIKTTQPCAKGFRRGQSKKPGPSDRRHCVEIRSAKSIEDRPRPKVRPLAKPTAKPAVKRAAKPLVKRKRITLPEYRAEIGFLEEI